jgi:hypothetical protein
MGFLFLWFKIWCFTSRKNNGIVDTGFLQSKRTQDTHLNNPASRIFAIFVSTTIAFYYLLMELTE